MAKVCSHQGCNNPVFSKGLCTMHWRWQHAKPIPQFSDSMVKQLAVYRKRRDEYFEKHPVCEFPGCNSRKITLHHKKGRVGKLLTDIRYFCSLCWKHHQYVGEHHEEAVRLGLSIDSTSNG